MDLTGKVFGEITVIKNVGQGVWNCLCSCGTLFEVSEDDLVSGTLKYCVHRKVKDLSGLRFGDWTAIRYIGNSSWECRCSCGEVKSVRTQYLKDGRSKSCGHDTTRFNDLSGKTLGEWTVLSYSGNQKWRCKCSCGTVRDVESYFLSSGKSKSCGHSTNKLAASGNFIDRTFQDVTGKRFGELEVIEYLGKGKWKCKCDCGNVVNRDRYGLTSGITTTCGHSINIRMIGQKFGRLTVLEPLSGYRARCLCDCGNETVVYINNLTAEHTRSCGCILEDMKLTREQIMEVILNYEKEYGERPYLMDLLPLINRSETVTRMYIDKFKLATELNQNFRSRAERDIGRIFEGAKASDRREIYPYELDLFIEDRKLAIEYNGTFWHSEAKKEKYYHRDKTLDCAKKGIRLIHIFEYEWENPGKRERIEKFLKALSKQDYRVINGRDTIVKQVDFSEVDEFLKSNHLQGSAKSSTNIGCYAGGELVGVMTFAKPRFNKDFQYELLRLCFKHDVKVRGGAEKMFKRFIEWYDPKSVITYCDISKFTGSVYIKLGFKMYGMKSLTEPNYSWVNPYTNEVCSRYKSQKHQLIADGYGDETQSEVEIMHGRGFYRVYDCGNLRFEWNK